MGFADVGAPTGRQLGNLRGLAAAALSFLQSSRQATPAPQDKDELVKEVRDIINGLSQLQFLDLVPPDEEAVAHAQEHASLSNAEIKLPDDLGSTRSRTEELTLLRERLRNVLTALNLGDLLQ